MKHQSIKVITNILYGIIITIAAVLVIETIICFAFRNDRVGYKYRVADPTPQKITSKQDKKNGKMEAFTELEQLRLLTKAPDENSTGSVIILTPWFSYPEGDISFHEELSLKRKQESSIIIDYFSNYTEQELRSKGESNIKNELCTLINKEMVLGQIKNVYFYDYLFVN